MSAPAFPNAEAEAAWHEAQRRIAIVSQSHADLLDLSGLGLTAVPPEIGQLTSLTQLLLANNQLTAVPPEIGQLTSLTTLWLDNNQLTAVPPEIGQLTSLTTLFLSDNQLTAVPPEIGQLANLTQLFLTDNQLTVVPPEIGQLANLTQLFLDNNKLTAVPPEIGQLTSLTTLFLTDNQLTAVPPEIGQLANLTHLYLSDNQLTAVPPEIGQLANLTQLYLHDNPLNDALKAAQHRGTRECLAFLRSLLDEGCLLEAKLLLVGEGNVGKSCLLAALCGENFIDRSTTHGMEIKHFQVDAPVFANKHGNTNARFPAGARLTLHGWDFGGQNIYRVTHQFFYSRRSLYLIVWNARETAEKCDVTGWLDRLRLRVGNQARVLIVCTQVDTVDRVPRIDSITLRDRFGDMIPEDGFVEVDSQTGRGISKLRTLIARESGNLPQMGEPFSDRWQAARQSVLDINREHIRFSTFRQKCREKGLDDTATATLAGLMHDLGDVVHFDDDDTLDAVVILKPEFLSKAIGFVLEDPPTNQAAGVLDHRRLEDIWITGRKKAEQYDQKLHPYFLRLMEKFDVSYRIDDQTSLVGQLVPEARPVLPWNSDDAPPPGQKQLTQIVQIDEDPPGLIPWLIVRHHRRRFCSDTARSTAGLHWHHGMVLADARHGQALIELRDRELIVTVRGNYPAHLLSILIESVTSLIDERWPGLVGRYHVSVPCPTVIESKPCRGRFELLALHKFKSDSDEHIRCQACVKKFSIDELLNGYATAAGDQFNRLHERLDEAERQRASFASAASQERAVIVGKLAEAVRLILRSQESEAREAPRLFTLFSDQWEQRVLHALDPRYWGRVPYRLTLWCEMPDDQHPLCPIGSTGDKGDAAQGEYVFTRPREWLAQISPLLHFTAQTLKLILPIIGSGVKAALSEALLADVSAKLDVMEQIAGAGVSGAGFDASIEDVSRAKTSNAFRQRGDGADLRSLHVLLNEIDKARRWGGLSRVLDKTSGDHIWICRRHRELYFDPPLLREDQLRPEPGS